MHPFRFVYFVAFIVPFTVSNFQGQSPQTIPNTPKFIAGRAGALHAKPLLATNDEPFQSVSVFDSVNNAFKSVTTSVEVHATEQELATTESEPFQAGGGDVVMSAGTYGDVSRYLQSFPGVVATSDLSNQMLVRGGHPMENLFMVDGIEVPNINHLANSNTTGGFGPMIDAAVIQGLKLYTGGFDAKFPERLSSVTEIQTLDSQYPSEHLEADFGVQGAGGLIEKNVRGGDLLVSGHHGLMNLVSNAVGIAGVPSYTNELTRYRKRSASGNQFTLLNVTGWDSIEIEPCASDVLETSTINSRYRGWRTTTGGEWQRVYSNRSFGVLNVSDSEQIEHINQEDQILNPLKADHAHIACPIPKDKQKTVPVYREDSNNAFSTVKYDYEWASSRMALTAGIAAWLQRPTFNVAQPIGSLSPYLSSPTRADATSFDSRFSTGESGSYAQYSIRPVKALSLSAGGRFQTFAFGAHNTFTPRLNISYRIAERVAIHAAYATYAQLPPYAYLLAYPINHSMAPMRATHEIVGADLGIIPGSQIRFEAYNKDYRDIPAATEYPAVTLHTMVDMLGEQTIWLPMTSKGRGNSSGMELSDMTRIGSRVQVQGSIAYSRAKFAGLDKVLRPSNFDLPWIINGAGVIRLGYGMVASGRYGYATGRPYTPFLMKASVAQNRPIYDLTNVNGRRSPFYSRLDGQISKEVRVGRQRLELYGGVDNILNRQNFLSYAWMPLAHTANPVGTLWQIPIFPNFGARFIVR